MPMITDWLMVIITFVYVFATICIMRANQKAANAAKEQLQETQRQFYSTNRPNITVEVIFERKSVWGLRFTNHGNQTAFNVTLDFAEDFANSLPEPEFKSIVKEAAGKTFALGINQHYDLFIGSHEYCRSGKRPIIGRVSYNGYDDSIYADDFNIDMDNYATIYSLTTAEEDLMKRLDKQNQLLEHANRLLREISNRLPEKENEHE